jgi:hypothetical protein
MEMRMVVTRIALGFEVAFAEEGGGGFEEGMMDCFTRQVPGLVLKFTPRR